MGKKKDKPSIYTANEQSDLEMDQVDAASQQMSALTESQSAADEEPPTKSKGLCKSIITAMILARRRRHALGALLVEVVDQHVVLLHQHAQLAVDELRRHVLQRRRHGDAPGRIWTVSTAPIRWRSLAGLRLFERRRRWR